MMRGRTVSGTALLVMLLTSCGGDEGGPDWSEELSTSLTKGASSFALYDVTRIEVAVADSDPLASWPEGCGNFTGSLATAGPPGGTAVAGIPTPPGDPLDTDGDGIPDNVTLTVTAENCPDGNGFVGKITVSDPGATRGYNYSADLTYWINPDVYFIRRTDTRLIRYRGATTTGKVNYREWFTRLDLGPASEEYGYSATFTLTPPSGTLAPGVFGPSTLTFEGWIDRQDDLEVPVPSNRFSIISAVALGLDPACGGEASVTGGVIEGKLNGSGPATFTRTWSGCGADLIEVSGTTD